MLKDYSSRGMLYNMGLVKDDSSKDMVIKHLRKSICTDTNSTIKREINTKLNNLYNYIDI